MLSVQNITKTFGKRTALSQVSFAFDKKVYGLVGGRTARAKPRCCAAFLQLYHLGCILKSGQVY